MILRLGSVTPPPVLFTALSLLFTWAAIPGIALGQLRVAALVAWLGVLLDLMDGKLPRPAFDLSAFMGKREHWGSLPALGLWYLALGWHCSDGELLASTPVALATWVLVGFFLLDRIVSGTFRKRHRRELFDYQPLDAAFHLIAARRNVSLLQLSVGALLDQPHLALVSMAAWMVCTLLFHAGRWLWVEVVELQSPAAGR